MSTIEFKLPQLVQSFLKSGMFSRLHWGDCAFFLPTLPWQNPVICSVKCLQITGN